VFCAEANLHRQLAYALLQQGELESALPYICRARELWLAAQRHKATPDGQAYIMRSSTVKLWAVGADIFEGLGRLDEAIKWDLEALSLANSVHASAQRRSMKFFTALGLLQVRSLLVVWLSLCASLLLESEHQLE
jgi:tetratricopeptide (TPR) repeat protein